MLASIPQAADPRTLVGFEASDDAAVFRLGAEGDPDAEAILSTVDFFTPIVESPFDFGRVAAANSLSDVYAMGGEPLFALNVAGFPTAKLPLDVLTEILKGGAAVAAEAGIPILGGHTVDFDVPFYGLVVNGRVKASAVRRNVGAREGDAIVLTKPIGSGILASALRARALSGLFRRGPDVTADEEAAAVATMARLNRHAARAADRFGVSACTDVTGFGLLGHLREMAAGSGVDAEVSVSAVPLLPGARRLAGDGLAPDGSRRNLDAARGYLEADRGLSETDLLLLSDAQTSGGLLFAAAPPVADDLVAAVRSGGDAAAARIGCFVRAAPGRDAGRVRATV